MQASDQRAADLPRHLVWVAYVIGAFGLGVSQQANFLIPLRARELGASFQVIGLIVGAAAIVPAVTSVPLGGIIDRFGSRRSFIAGTTLTAVVGLGFVAATSYWALLGLQLMLGAVRTMAWLASQSYITGLGSTAERAGLAGRFALFANIGTMVGPLVAGLVAQFVGYRFAFGWLALYALSFAVLGWMLAETHVRRDAQRDAQDGAKPKGGFRTAAGHLGLRGIQVALLLSFARLWNDKLWTSFFPVYLADVGFQPGVIGTVVFAKGLVGTVLAPTAGFFSRFMSPQSLAAMGLGCGALGLVVSPHVAALPWVFLATALMGIGTGLSLPLLLAIVSDAAPEGQRGVALGLRMAMNQVAGGSAPLLFGLLVGAVGMVSGFATVGVFVGAVLVASRAPRGSGLLEAARERRRAAAGRSWPQAGALSTLSGGWRGTAESGLGAAVVGQSTKPTCCWSAPSCTWPGAATRCRATSPLWRAARPATASEPHARNAHPKRTPQTHTPGNGCLPHPSARRENKW